MNTRALTFALGKAGTTLQLNYAHADELCRVEGVPANDAVAEAKRYGFSLNFFLAGGIETE